MIVLFPLSSTKWKSKWIVLHHQNQKLVHTVTGRSHAARDSPPPLVGFDSNDNESQPCHELTVSEDVHVDVDIPQSHSDGGVDQGI